MKKKIVVAALILGLSVCSISYAFEGRHPRGRHFKSSAHEILAQLPSEKEMLFHRTMRELREETKSMREQIKNLRAEIKDIFTAAEFDENLFREKTGKVHELRAKMREARDKAMVKLATQLTAEERKIVAELIPPRQGRHGGRLAR